MVSMTYKVVYHQQVEDDLFTAKDWYKKQQNGLEKRFAQEVKKSVIFISKNPLMFELRYKETRTAYTKIFPFGIHFHVNQYDRVITILGIFHTSMNPDKWGKR